MSEGRITPEPWTEVDGDRVELAATLSIAGQSHRLWWRAPLAWRDAITPWADPFVLAFVFPMMGVGGDVVIEGRCSPSLLANLETFNQVWMMWAPSHYTRPLRIRATEEAELPPADEPDARICSFSCGVDSCFTAYRHARGLAGRNSRRIGAGVTMFGFDVVAGEQNVAARYAQLRESAASMLASLGIPMIELDTNFRTLPQLWRHSHGTQVGAALSLFSRRFGGALLPNTTPYTQLDYGESRLGSHPVSDPLMSSRGFPIADDGATHRRWQKIEAILAWPEAMAGLRVCFGAEGNVGNCGRCEKCYRTAASFLIAGRDPPAGLPRDFSRRAIRHLRPSPSTAIFYWQDLVEQIDARGLTREPWAAGVRAIFGRSRRALLAKQLKRPFLPARNAVRKFFRGTTKSRKQIAAQTAEDRAASTDA